MALSASSAQADRADPTDSAGPVSSRRRWRSDRRLTWAPAERGSTTIRPDGGRTGEQVGIGRTAEVFAIGDGRILKLLRPGFPDRLGLDEARIGALINAIGLPAPRLLGTERVDGRFGLLYERLLGPSMLDRLTNRPWLVDALAGRFAALHAEMHTCSGAGLPDVKVSWRHMIERAAERLGTSRAEAAQARLERTTDGSVVCHADMHPGNVIMTSAGPIVIDWLTARSGPPEADIARTLFLLTESAVPDAYPRWQRAAIEALRRRFAATYLRRYRRLHRVDERQLDLWRLPVLAARLGEDIGAEADRLVRLVDAELARAPIGPAARR
jgi:aminoglycoside phosphotransferase (APT) family kinase protein